MPEKLIAIMLSVLLALSATAQDEATDDTAGPDSADAEQVDDEAGSEEDEELEDSDLDDQSYEEDDDDFVPTEEIRADEPIPFPTDI